MKRNKIEARSIDAPFQDSSVESRSVTMVTTKPFGLMEGWASYIDHEIMARQGFGELPKYESKMIVFDTKV